MIPMKTVTLYRPVGPVERQLIEESGWLKFPPRLPEQPNLLSGYERRIRNSDRARLERT
jgi:hypothetical protein